MALKSLQCPFPRNPLCPSPSIYHKSNPDFGLIWLLQDVREDTKKPKEELKEKQAGDMGLPGSTEDAQSLRQQLQEKTEMVPLQALCCKEWPVAQGGMLGKSWKFSSLKPGAGQAGAGVSIGASMIYDQVHHGICHWEGAGLRQSHAVKGFFFISEQRSQGPCEPSPRPLQDPISPLHPLTHPPTHAQGIPLHSPPPHHIGPSGCPVSNQLSSQPPTRRRPGGH